MAHITQIADDCRHLVSRIIEQNGHSISESALEQQYKVALRDVRATHYPRTNQFDIEKRLDGLEEKFSVLNNDALSEALKRTRGELAATSYKYSPEILSLLLLLSDRPAEKTRIEDLSAKLPVLDYPSLTWQDILADDPQTEAGIWDYIEHGSHSSEYISHDEGHFVSKSATLEEDGFLERDLHRQLLLTHSATDAVQDVLSLRNNAAKAKSESTTTSDIQVIRYIIRSLQGLPAVSNTTGGSGLTSDHFGPKTLHTILKTVQEYSDNINWLLNWAHQDSTDALTQRLKHAALRWLQDVDVRLSRIEERCMDQDIDMTLSLQSVVDDITMALRPVVHLSELVQRSIDIKAPWQTLDALYNECALLDISNQISLLRSFSELFRSCLLIYLKSFELWMSSGSLERPFKQDFFISKVNQGQSDKSGTLWHGHFRITARDGTPDVVPFLAGQAEKIFRCGKSAAFQRALGQEPEKTPEAALYFTEEAIVHPAEDNYLSTFTDRFQLCLQAWLQDSFHVSAGRLNQILLSQHCLIEVIESVGKIMLGGDGAGMDNFGYALYEYVDAGIVIGDIGQSTLTALAQNAFDDHLRPAQLDGSLVICKSGGTDQDPIGAMSGFEVKLRFPWPLQNISREPEPIICQRAFPVLLGLHRARHKLAQLGIRELTATRHHSVTRLLKMRQKLRWLTDITYTCLCEAGAKYTASLVSEIKTAHDIESMVKAYDQFTIRVQTAFLLDDQGSTTIEKLAVIMKMVDHLCSIWPVAGAKQERLDHDRPEELTRMLINFDTTLSSFSSTLRSLESEASGTPNLLARLETCRG
ncbi:hypothetical protein K461DRAFT_293698 [Myriangium duriaei CBS 260.36]|uniref:Spindle pole body component n=1 Tax=Myriangium duriaei CBS 260.36 TaxID=1168546 RepID=A0A9P4MHR2_9PEZI|nr:hypothetical protein K461DRAFT_293698 [Myriangium duriaei CBS 260.36]